MKDWQRRMDGFSSGSKPKIRLPAVDLSKDQVHLSQGISWSSSDEDDNATKGSCSKPIIMMCLDFDECVRHTGGHSKPKVSRSLIESRSSSHVTTKFPSPKISDSKYLDVTVSMDTKHLKSSTSTKFEPQSPVVLRDFEKEEQTNTFIPLQDLPFIESPKSPVISLSRRRRNVPASCDSQLPFTPRPTSPIISKKKSRSTSRRRPSSPVLRKRNKRRRLLSGELQTARCRLEDSLTECSQAVSVICSPPKAVLPASKQVSMFSNRHIQGSSQESQIDENLSPLEPYGPGSKESLELVPRIHEYSSQNSQLPFLSDKMPLPMTKQRSIIQSASSQDNIIDVSSQEESGSALSIEVISSQEPSAMLTNYQMLHSYAARVKMEQFDKDDCQIQELPVSSSSQSTVASTSNMLLDSACKTKPGKPVKNGLVWRLNRLLARQRSSQRMWQHERSLQDESDIQKGYQLFVRSVGISWGKAVAYCQSISSSGRVAVILPPGKKLHAKSRISIFPPWQQFEPAGLGMPVLLGVSLMEIHKTQDDESSTETPTLPHSSKQIDNFTCHCRQDSDVLWHVCKFQLPEQQLLKLLFWPQEEQVERGRLHAVETTGDKELTVAAAVSSHSRNPTQPLQLLLYCHRLCAYSIPVNLVGLTTQNSDGSQGSTQGCSNSQWCLLGQDSQGEICLVELGRRTGPLKEGTLFHLQDLSLSRRTEAARSPRLYSMIKSLFPQTLQTIIFEFSSSHCQALRLAEEPVNFTWVPPSLASPADVTSTSQEQRVTLLVILLYYHSSSMLYVQSVSPGWEECLIPYVRVTVQPSASLPSNLLPNTLLCLRDLSCINGELFLDRFSAVINVTSHSGPQLLNWLPKIPAFKNLPLPPLTVDSSVGDLVSVQGIVVSVDEDNACVWPVCGQCGNEVLKEVTPDNFECLCCKSTGPFLNRVSLTVELPGHISIKLQQKTIEQLLPDCQNNSECYLLESILGQSLESLKCYFAEKSRASVSLEELPHST